MLLDSIDHAARVTAYAVAGGIFVNILDDLHIDLRYFRYRLQGKGVTTVTMEKLLDAPQKRVAIMVPAWKEAEVIERMLDHNLATIDYSHDRYDIFVGTYRNDPETQARVDAVVRRAPNVHKVVVDRDGPTSKADCLNCIYEGIVATEGDRGRPFDILLMHDAEDVIHPVSLRLYSLLIPDNAFVQTPVFSLPVPSSQLVAGTYIDEFAEHHQKDMLVREAMGGLVPSAGVGSAFAREAFEEIARAHGRRAFNAESLTEDYEIGLKFRLANKKACFACFSLSDPKKKKSPEIIATREYFPSALGASVRQRSRWILGISLQTWEQLGWRGSLPVLYCLWRDRKALVTNALVLLAYLLVLYVMARGAIGVATGESWGLNHIAPARSPLWWLLQVNAAMLVWRLVMKATFVGRLYGVKHGIMSAPRMILGNLIAIAATTRAVTTYARHRVTGEPLRWLKTSHAFLGHEAQRALPARLGDALVASGTAQPRQIEEGLALQKVLRLPLGQVLALSGAVSPRAVTMALAAQWGMPFVDPDPRTVPLELLRRLPEVHADHLNVLPLRFVNERVQLAVGAPLAREDHDWIAARLDAGIEAQLAESSALRRARAYAYRRLVIDVHAHARLGERLLEIGALDEATLRMALDEQSSTGERLGELLFRRRLVAWEPIAEALGHRYRRAVEPGDADVDAMAILGSAFCALHSLAPLRRKVARGKRIIASPFHIHPLVRDAVARRLDEEVEVDLTPLGHLRVALAVASRSPRVGGRDGLFAGVDGAEMATIVRCTNLGKDPVSLLRAARAAAMSPVAYLESIGRLDRRSAALIRARALGVPHVEGAGATAHERLERASLIPPSLALHGCAHVRAINGEGIVLASHEPTPALARRVASLLPDTAIAWAVAVEEDPHGGNIAA